MKKILSIIPARGGSKGIPGKNIRLLCGKPLITWTIEAALNSRSIERVIVSTDDERIAKVARESGAEVVARPPEISGDFAPSEAALLHVLEHLSRTEGYDPDILVFLQCTSPLVQPGDIDGTVDLLFSKAADSAFSATHFCHFLWREGHDGAIGMNHDKSLRQMRQEREDQFLENGAVYAMKTPGFISARHRFFGKTEIYVMPSERSTEIDSLHDFEIAALLLEESARSAKIEALPKSVKAIIFDFDGVFTDNRVIVLEDGREGVFCNRSDGLGISMLKKAGIMVLVLSKEKNPVVEARCRKLDISCIQGIDDKIERLKEFIASEGMGTSAVVYVGNDVNDLECMRFVACPVAVADAHPDVLKEAKIVLDNPGGKGAVREICDLILKSRENKRNMEAK